MMKKIIFVALIFQFTAMVDMGFSQDAEKIEKLNTPAEKLGYALGSDIGRSFRNNEMKIDTKSFIKGFTDGMSENAVFLLTPEEVKEIQESAIVEMRKKTAEKKKADSENNKIAQERFFYGNAKKEGVITTKSGLQYKIIREGTGPKPKMTDRVQVNYVGRFLDGTEFDKSYGIPAVFAVNGVIRGWTETLLMMNTGSKWQVFVPSKLAYGDQGAGIKIGPNVVLIFDIELIGIENSSNGEETH